MIDFTDLNILPWLIPVGPLVAFLIISAITNRGKLTPAHDIEPYGGFKPPYGDMLVGVVSPTWRFISIVVGMTGAVWAFVIAWFVAFNGIGIGEGVFGKTEVFANRIDWMATGTSSFTMGVLVDPLTVAMLVMVPLAVLMIFIYSIGYMAHDPRQARFFALISLFAGAMLTLTVADNLLLLFVGWEVMGLCSYMLIGFWFEKKSAYDAAMKAFMTTRVADVIMLLGIAYLYTLTGTLSFREILYNPEMLDMLASTPAIVFGGMSASALIGVFLIIGTIGKSAQFPLHVWLPDAMEGPTPVSAMIHAAAMVSAGIYAIIRMYPLFEAGAHPHDGLFNAPLLLMAVVGAFTAIFAATIAVAQNDVKKVLAYSTISQLGFMMAALGIGAYIAAAFHLITHAFFKALLFMASGAVIHAMEHGEHHVHHMHHSHDDDDEHAHTPGHGHGDHALDDDHAIHEPQVVYDEHGHPVSGQLVPAHAHAHAFDPQDMMNMGGLSKRIPVTWWTFLIGGLSLAGFPLITAGFWSKDEILADAWLGVKNLYGPQALVFFLLAIAAFLTAFYTARQLSLTFLGEPRTEEAAHAGLGGPRSIVSITMQLPLIILAFFALFAGFVGVPPDFPIFGSILAADGNPFFDFVKYTLLPEMQPAKPPFDWLPVLTSFGVALGGLWLGWFMYGRKPLVAGQPDPLVKILGPMHNILKNKYYFDELYDLVLVRPMQAVSAFTANIVDRGLIDGILHAIARISRLIGDFFKTTNLWLIDGVGDGIPAAIGRFGMWFRQVQTGRVQNYLLLAALFALIIGLVFAASVAAAN